MSEFKKGDPVRLKAKPDVVGLVVDSARCLVTVEAGGGAWLYRYAAELEAAPLTPEEYVGKRVRVPSGLIYQVLAVHPATCLLVTTLYSLADEGSDAKAVDFDGVCYLIAPERVEVVG